MNGTHNLRIDPQRNHLLTLSALRGNGIGEERHTTALGAHQHIALVVDDEIQLGDYDADVAQETLFGVCASEFVDFGEGVEDADGRGLGSFGVEYWGCVSEETEEGGAEADLHQGMED